MSHSEPKLSHSVNWQPGFHCHCNKGACHLASVLFPVVSVSLGNSVLEILFVETLTLIVETDSKISFNSLFVCIIIFILQGSLLFLLLLDYYQNKFQQ